MNKNVSLGCVLALMALTLGNAVDAENKFENNETYYSKLCSDYTSRKENAQVCGQFEHYLKARSRELNTDLESLKQNMQRVKGSLDADNKELEAIHEKNVALKNILIGTREAIEISKGKIATSEQAIVVLDSKIKAEDARVRSYMVNMQGSERVNNYIGFIMGAHDFNEASRRIAGIAQINAAQLEIVRQMRENRKEIEVEKERIVFEQRLLEEKEHTQEETLKQQESLLLIARQKVAALEVQYESMTAAQEALIEQQRVTQIQLSNFGDLTLSNAGLVRPISSGFYVSASQWNYPYDGDALDGKKHLGVDFAAPVGTPLRAPGAGIVIAVFDGCKTSGSFGCGSGFGNYMLMIVTANDKVYGVLYAHIEKSSFTVRVGQQVAQGQQVARVGNSGNSYGAHVHVETYYLGNDSIQGAYNRWYQKGSNMFFNTYGTSSALEPSTRCVNNGGVAPCRLITEAVFGVKLKHRY